MKKNDIFLLPSDNLSLHSLHALVKNSLLSAFIPILQHKATHLHFPNSDLTAKNRNSSSC